MEIAMERGRFYLDCKIYRSMQTTTTICALAYEAVSSSSMGRCYHLQWEGVICTNRIDWFQRHAKLMMDTEHL
jgi:hypothetical protein